MQREIFTAKLHATFAPPETIDVLGLHGEVNSISELNIHEHIGSGEIALPDLIGDLTPDQPITVFDLGRQVNLNAIAIGLGLESIEFEPQVFAGLAYAPESIEGVVVLFGGGNGFTVGEGIEERTDATENMIRRIEELELISESELTILDHDTTPRKQIEKEQLI